MKAQLNLKEMKKFVNWVTFDSFEHETREFSAKNKKEELKKWFSEIKNKEDLLEVFYDTNTFRDEMEVLEHKYATATGSNYDKMLVEFRNEKYVINDRMGWINPFIGIF